MRTHNINQQLTESQRLFKKAVARAAMAYQRGDLNSAVAWAKIAAHFAFARHPGFYTSAELERLLLMVAQKIGGTPTNPYANLWAHSKIGNSGKMRFLHVITESYGTGGHSPFIARWIKNTKESSTHSLIATAHHGQLPGILTTSVSESGGWYCSLADASSNLLEQSLLLRQLARNWADIIVLFIHPFDPLPLVAFGVNGGPPVIFCNHADHAFWLGVSVADVVVDYHSLGGSLCAKRRGIRGSKILPIPLLKNCFKPRNSLVRKELGLSDDEVMLLTIGRPEKFLPFGNYNFLKTIVKVLERHPNVKLFAVGPLPNGEWEKASALVGGRIKALGTIDRSALESFYEGTDLYVPSFPCGSQTALLEVGMHGIPIVGLGFREVPHVSGGDDVAFEKDSVHAASVAEFVAMLESMIADCDSYRQKAAHIKENIESEHCPPRWNLYLDDVLQSLPFQHKVRKPKATPSKSDCDDVYFSYVDSEMFSNELLEHSFGRLIRVYAKHLSKSEVLRAQAECFLGALPKIGSVRDVKNFVYNLREFLAVLHEF